MMISKMHRIPLLSISTPEAYVFRKVREKNRREPR
jgi:hypothetical protein